MEITKIEESKTTAGKLWLRIKPNNSNLKSVKQQRKRQSCPKSKAIKKKKKKDLKKSLFAAMGLKKYMIYNLSLSEVV